jgi:ferredoxin-type protein NapH
MISKPTFTRASLVPPAIVLLALWGAGALAWFLAGSLTLLVFLGYTGAAAALGVALFLALPRADRMAGRKATMALIGTGLLVAAVLRAAYDNQVVQLEGAFFELLSGVFQAAALHYLVAKVLGPLLFGRVWCGWACWTGMVLDLLPYRRSPGRLRGRWGWLRYAHFAASLALAAVVVYAFGAERGAVPGGALAWFLAGNALYYALGIGLALALKDNRAFCKYACPITVPLKLGARVSLLKVVGDPERCNRSHECSRVCPMDIDVSEYVRRGERVLSSECILCQACIGACGEEVLELSFGVERPGRERLRLRGEPFD